MLCDVLLSSWADPASYPKFEPEVERLIRLSQNGDPDGEIKKSPMSRTRMLEVRATMERWLHEHIHLCSKEGIAFSELISFREMLACAHKFYVSPEFALASLQDFATPETIIKAKNWFRLIHDPMWLEWHYEDCPGMRLGALFYDHGHAEEPEYRCYLVSGMLGNQEDPEYRLFSIHHLRLRSEEVNVGDSGVSMPLDDLSQLPAENDRIIRGFAIQAYDFIIRINSPRITDFRPCDDMTKLNKKRMRLGRMPLCSYQIVDLTKEIKRDLRQADCEGEGGVRFHWRRGHFKLLSDPRYKEPGLHWWNPHTAGRKVYGEIRKDYVA